LLENNKFTKNGDPSKDLFGIFSQKKKKKFHNTHTTTTMMMSIGSPSAPAMGAAASSGGPRVTTDPASKLQLNFSCKGLKNRDTMSKSDPRLYIYSLEEGYEGREVLIGMTETAVRIYLKKKKKKKKKKKN
jgi:hypothetical protein